MNTIFQNLLINRVIVHEIFKREIDQDSTEPRYSNELVLIEQEGKDALQDRIVRAVDSTSHCIEMDIDSDDEHSTFDIIFRMIESKDKEFISYSQKLTERLNNAQYARQIPGGIVVVFDGTTGHHSKSYLGIIKADIQNGFERIIREEKILLQFLDDLLLTPQQKLYKIGLFIQRIKRKTISKDDFNAYVYDHNLTSDETRQAAIYFYRGFLGCSISPTDKKLTKDFFTQSKEFIKDLDADDITKYDLNTSLYTYLKVSNKTTVRTKEFAEEYLSGIQRDTFMKFMQDKGFPRRAIMKDIVLIKSKLKRRKMRFTNRVEITSPSDNIHDLVQIVDQASDSTTVKIFGKLAEEK